MFGIAVGMLGGTLAERFGYGVRMSAVACAAMTGAGVVTWGLREATVRKVREMA